MEPEPKVPADLRKALAADPAAKVKWNELTPLARRDFIMWIDVAKQADTRARRIEQTCDKLVAGKRRPCCFALVPLDLHNALKAAPKAKAQWSGLGPGVKRDFISWIESAKERETRKGRVAKACTMIASGKRLP